MKRQIGILLSAVSLAVSLTASAAAANYSDEMKLKNPARLRHRKGRRL